MKVFLTGGSGHLGANIARQLLDQGHDVRALTRSGSNNAALDGLAIDRVVGDLRNAGAIRSWLSGCDRVVHAAAMISLRRRDRPAMFEANVTGTRNLLRACLDAQVERVVHCSSVGALGHDPSGRTTEDTPPNPLDEQVFYDRTKFHAEFEVLQAASAGLQISIINPSGLIGPQDFKPSHIGQMILDFAHGRIPLYVQGGYDFVPVEDVARGCLLALEHGKPGRRYLLTGEHVEVQTILSWLSQLLHRPAPRIGIPGWLMLPIATFKDEVEQWVAPRRHPRFNRESIYILSHPKHPVSARARDELGWSPGSVEAAVRRQVEFFRAQGQLP